MPSGASSCAARIRARLYDPRLRLPATAAIRSTTRTRCDRQAIAQEVLGATGARLQVLGDGQRLFEDERAVQIGLEPKRGALAGPAGGVVDHDGASFAAQWRW